MKKSNEKTVMINSLKKIELVPVGHVLYLEAAGECTYIVALGHKKYTSTKNLGSCCEALKAYNINRLGKSYAVNLNRIESFDGKTRKIFFSHDIAITIPKEQVAEFKLRLKSHCISL